MDKINITLEDILAESERIYLTHFVAPGMIKHSDDEFMINHGLVDEDEPMEFVEFSSEELDSIFMDE